VTSTRERLDNRLRATVESASRADHHAILRALKTIGDLDDHSIAFLRTALAQVLVLASALNTTVEAHQPISVGSGITCGECGSRAYPCPTVRRAADALTYAPRRTIDPADAWRRAAAHFRPVPGSELLISVREIADAYVTRPARLVLPEPPAVPTPATERVLLVDKATGARWNPNCSRPGSWQLF
jgi:hypothetical protein